MSDVNERSDAMPGSQPTAVSVHIDNSASAFPDSRPLRRASLALTDEEREAILLSAREWEDCVDEQASARAETLRKLLDRTK